MECSLLDNETPEAEMTLAVCGAGRRASADDVGILSRRSSARVARCSNRFSPLRHPAPRRGCVAMHERPILVISSGARDLAFSATCEEKISRLRLEMTIVTQSGRGGEKRWRVGIFFKSI
jgi:hypothetical protein